MIFTKQFFRTSQITRIALSAVLLAVCSQIMIPTTIPFTLQTFGVCFVAGLLGSKEGFWSVLLFLVMGAIGLPVFSGFSGGLSVLAGVTGGYLVGFLFTAVIVGLAGEHFGRKPLVLILSMCVGILVCYACGTIWFYVVYLQMQKETGIAAILAMCVIPYLLPDLIKVLLAAFLVRRLEAPLKEVLSR